MPCSGLTGANLKEPVAECPWYTWVDFINMSNCPFVNVLLLLWLYVKITLKLLIERCDKSKWKCVLLSEKSTPPQPNSHYWQTECTRWPDCLSVAKPVRADSSRCSLFSQDASSRCSYVVEKQLESNLFWKDATSTLFLASTSSVTMKITKPWVGIWIVNELSLISKQWSWEEQGVLWLFLDYNHKQISFSMLGSEVCHSFPTWTVCQTSPDPATALSGCPLWTSTRWVAESQERAAACCLLRSVLGTCVGGKQKLLLFPFTGPNFPYLNPSSFLLSTHTLNPFDGWFSSLALA